MICWMLVELSDGLTRVHLDKPVVVPSAHQTVLVGPRRVAAREVLSKPVPPSLFCLRVDPRVTCKEERDTSSTAKDSFKIVIMSQLSRLLYRQRDVY